MEIRQGKLGHRELPGHATWIVSTFSSSIPELQMILQLDTSQGQLTSPNLCVNSDKDHSR